jgi:hypothetical protein
MLVRWRRLVAFDLGFWTRTLVVGEDHAITGLRAPSDDAERVTAVLSGKGWQRPIC